MEPNITCTICKLSIQASWNFCPNCGKILREKPLSTSLFKQLTIYAISFFLPPFGLGMAFQYLKQKETKARMIGIISIFLTVLSIVLVIMTFKSFMDYYSKILNNIGSGNYP